MGAHKDNPIALLHKAAPPKPLFEMAYGFEFEVVIEPNAAKKAEIQAFLDAELAAGKKPGEINTGFQLTPEEQDLVVYNRICQARPSRLVQQTPVARLRCGEHMRMPLTEVMSRAEEAFAAHRAGQATDA